MRVWRYVNLIDRTYLDMKAVKKCLLRDTVFTADAKPSKARSTVVNNSMSWPPCTASISHTSSLPIRNQNMSNERECVTIAFSLTTAVLHCKLQEFSFHSVFVIMRLFASKQNHLVRDAFNAPALQHVNSKNKDFSPDLAVDDVVRA